MCAGELCRSLTLLPTWTTVAMPETSNRAYLQKEEHNPAKRLQNAELDDKPKHEDVHQQQQHQPIV